MKKYVVYVPEVHYQRVEIEAENEEDALELVMDGEGNQIGNPEYEYTLDDEDAFEVVEL